MTVSFNYLIPAFGPKNGNHVAKALLSGWTLGGILSYGSGQPIQSPGSNNSLGSVLFQNTFQNRVPGVPLYLKDLNCHCFDPNKDFVLNPAAWSDPAPGTWGTAAAYYSDYRSQRKPTENFNVGRTFRIREAMSFSVRAEFVNVFNRTVLPAPTTAPAAPTCFVRASPAVSAILMSDRSRPIIRTTPIPHREPDRRAVRVLIWCDLVMMGNETSPRARQKGTDRIFSTHKRTGDCHRRARGSLEVGKRSARIQILRTGWDRMREQRQGRIALWCLLT
jgi:hypothetical protein